MEKFTNITKNQISQMGVQALADRPNVTQQYGVNGLSATKLKLHFDKLADFLASKINEMHNGLSSDKAAEYIRVTLDEYGISSLWDLIESLVAGSFADKFLFVYPTVDAKEKQTLEAAFHTITTDNFEDHEKLWKEIGSLGYGYTGASASIEEDGGEFGVDLQIKNLTYGKELHFCFKNIVQSVLDSLPTYGGETT